MTHEGPSAPSVLLVGMYYAPETTGSAPYTADTAEALAAAGARVTVVTTHPHYPSWQRAKGVRNRWRAQYLNGVRVYRVPCYVPSTPTLARRLAYELTFIAAALPQFLRFKPDLVVGTSPNLFSACAAMAIGRLRKRPVVQLVQDVVSTAGVQTGHAQGRSFASSMLARIESFALRRATAVTIPSDSFRATMGELGVAQERIHTVRNWSRLPDPPPTKAPALQQRHRLGWDADDLVILHTGNIGLKQSLHEFVPTARSVLAALPHVRFVFMGDGNQRQALVGAVGASDRLVVQPPVDANEYLATLMAADILLVHEKDTVVDMSLPSKLTSYFAAGKPVVAVTQPSSATARELQASGAGIVVAHDDPGGLLRALVALKDPAVSSKMTRAAAEFRRDHLDRSIATQKVVHLCLAAVQGQEGDVPALDAAR